MSTEVGRSLHIVVYRGSSKCMEKDGGLLQPIWTVSLDNFIKCVVSAGIETKRNENVTTSLNMF